MNKHSLSMLSIVTLLSLSALGCDDEAVPQEPSPADEMAQDALNARDAQDQQIQRDRDELRDLIGDGASGPGPVAEPTTSPTSQPGRDRDDVRRGLLGGD